MRIRSALIATLSAASTMLLSAGAAAESPAPGEYITEHGWGTLKVAPAPGGTLKFSIESVGANGHSCTVDGQLVRGEVVVSDLPPPRACVILMKAKGRAVEVSTNGDASCQPSFCGMRAGFVGTYLLAPAGCRATERRKAGDEFKRLYVRKDYTAAEAVADRLYQRCEGTMHWLELGSLRNDLAITQHHLGHRDACLKTLAPQAKDAALPDDTLRNQLPPGDYENYLPIVQATRTNLRLCHGAKATS